MGRIDDLIQKYCPEGVPMVPLGDLLKYEQPTKYIVQNTNYDDSYTTPVLTAGQSFILGFTNETDGIFSASIDEPVIIFDDFVTSFHWVDFDFKVKSSAMKMLRPKNNTFSFRYVYYAMCCIGFIPSEHTRHWISRYSQFEIPLPPLPIQEAIVEILEKIDRLSAELQAELQARKQQYEYYRNQLLTRFAPDQPVTEYSLGDICDTLSGFPFDSTQFQDNGIRLMRGMNIKRGFLDFSEENNRYWDSTAGLEKYLLEDQDIVMSMDGSLVGKSFGIIEKKDLPLILVQRVARIRSTKANIRYIYYCITNFFPDYVDKKKTGGAIPHISMKDINNFKIVLPSLAEQARIVAILDKFEALVNDLSQGLPAEIAAVQEQYEYYRNKLLTFKTKE